MHRLGRAALHHGSPPASRLPAPRSPAPSNLLTTKNSFASSRNASPETRRLHHGVTMRGAALSAPTLLVRHLLLVPSAQGDGTRAAEVSCWAGSVLHEGCPWIRGLPGCALRSKDPLRMRCFVATCQWISGLGKSCLDERVHRQHGALAKLTRRKIQELKKSRLIALLPPETGFPCR